MNKIRNILVTGAAALALPLAAVASPAGASTPHPKFIKAIHSDITHSIETSDQKWANLGEAVCAHERYGQSYVTVTGLLESQGYKEAVSDIIVTDSQKYLCPNANPYYQEDKGGGIDPYVGPPSHADELAFEHEVHNRFPNLSGTVAGGTTDNNVSLDEVGQVVCSNIYAGQPDWQVIDGLQTSDGFSNDEAVFIYNEAPPTLCPWAKSGVRDYPPPSTPTTTTTTTTVSQSTGTASPLALCTASVTGFYFPGSSDPIELGGLSTVENIGNNCPNQTVLSQAMSAAGGGTVYNSDVIQITQDVCNDYPQSPLCRNG